MVFCIQNCAISTRIASLYWSQTSPVVFALKRVTLAPELQVSIGPSPHLWFFDAKTMRLAPELLISMGPRPHLSFCACKTA